MRVGEPRHQPVIIETVQPEPLPIPPDTAPDELSILLVDDEPGIRLLLNKALKAQGYHVHEAKDGITGLEQFYTVQPDLILLDITMPSLDGFAVLKEIRQHNPVVGIVMVSALSPKLLTVEAMTQGADGYIHKPFKLQEIFKEIQRVHKLVQFRRYSTARQHNLGKINLQLYRGSTRSPASTIVSRSPHSQPDSQVDNHFHTASVLFLDLSNFSAVGYQRNANDIVQIVNQHLSLAATAVMNNGGYIDKFTGDGFMALFDAMHLPDHATCAVRAASQIQLQLQQLTRLNTVTLETRVGIHSGEIILGNMGTPQLMTHTAIGDTVNLAKHLEELAAPNTTLLSAETYKLLNPQALATDRFQVRYWGDFAFRLRQQATKVYEVICDL